MKFRSFFVNAHDPVLVAVERLKAKASDQLPSVHPERLLLPKGGNLKWRRISRFPPSPSRERGFLDEHELTIRVRQ